MYFEAIVPPPPSPSPPPALSLLTAQNPVPLNTEFVVGGYDKLRDGGGGTFIWIPVDTTVTPLPPEDLGIIFWGADPNGYFMRIYSGPINVRWFGAKGDADRYPLHDDTTAVNRARASEAFANNGTLYFPKGTYMGAFVFDFDPLFSPPLNGINVVGDGRGTILKYQVDSNGNPTGKPVVTLGYRSWNHTAFPNWVWARVSNLTILGGPDPRLGGVPPSNGVEFANPGDPSLNDASGGWVLERVTFTKCKYGVYKKGSLGNHFIDCTWNGNEVGVWAETAPLLGANGASDRYSGGSFENCSTACLQYIGSAPQLIIDGAVFEYNHTAWAISIKLSGEARMLQCAICIRNVWFEGNGDFATKTGGDFEFEGVRSVRIDDTGITGRIRLVDSSVNLYNCKLDSDAGGILSGDHYVDDRSSLVAYEHRYLTYPTSKVFVNSISYDGSQDILGQGWQPTSVWGPLRSVVSTRRNIVASNHFDDAAHPESFTYLPFPPGTDTTVATISSMRVLGKGSGKLQMRPDRIRGDNNAGVLRAGAPRYVVWSMHTFLETPVPDGYTEDQVYGELTSTNRDLQYGINLGRFYFKHNQWACSYGMKLVSPGNDNLTLWLDFQSEFDGMTTFYITDYQIVEFASLHDANAFVNSREFATYTARE